MKLSKQQAGRNDTTFTDSDGPHPLSPSAETEPHIHTHRPGDVQYLQRRTVRTCRDRKDGASTVLLMCI